MQYSGGSLLDDYCGYPNKELLDLSVLQANSPQPSHELSHQAHRCDYLPDGAHGDGKRRLSPNIVLIMTDDEAEAQPLSWS
jgi:hypothetical protein